jgi:Tol biopolymer transport system component
VRRHLAPAVLGFSLALALAGTSSTSGATRTATGVTGSDHGGSGATRLYWSQFRDLDFNGARIMAADGHGRHVRVLTHPAPGVVDLDPKVSPDGSRILFERDFPDTSRVGVVNADGTGERLLPLGCTDPCAGVAAPTWTPDGHHVVVTRVIGPFDAPNESARSAVLWRSDLSGRHRVRLSQRGIDGTFEDYAATFAPAGYVVFIRLRNSDVASAAFRMDPDGTDVRRLTRWALDADELSVSPAASGPTRDLVVLETYGHGAPEGFSQAVATVSARPPTDGRRFSRVRFLTSQRAQPVQNFNPAWAPGGRRIAYVHFSFDSTKEPAVVGDIWRMRWDGTAKQRVSRSPLFDFRPAWGPRPVDDARAG